MLPLPPAVEGSVRMSNPSLVKFAVRTSVVAGLLATAATALGQAVPILQPGAPGQPTRPITAVEASRIADTQYTSDDVRFMQQMIVHHQQAVDMAALVKERTNRQAIVDVSRRIDVSQADEMSFMRNWLRERGQPAADPHAAHMLSLIHI